MLTEANVSCINHISIIARARFLCNDSCVFAVHDIEKHRFLCAVLVAACGHTRSSPQRATTLQTQRQRPDTKRGDIQTRHLLITWKIGFLVLGVSEVTQVYFPTRKS